ncbi:MAG: flagellar basal body-associated FliL family protein [Caldimonas sp.]
MSAVMADPAAVDDAPAPRRPKKKLILIGAGVLALVLALGAGTAVFLKQRAAHAAAAAAEDDGSGEPAPAAANVAKSIPFYLPLDPFVVNLADRDVDRYAQIGITLELENGVAGDQIKAYMPAIRNAVLLILANKSSKELLSREGKEQLATEIMREAVRPMGIEIAAPEPVTAAPVVVAMAPAVVAMVPASGAMAASAAGAESAPASAIAAESPASAKPRQRRRVETQRNPIQHVHFSSFIIQ